jgi:CRISPR-associated protein Cmr2
MSKEPFWQAKIWGLLHDPALKALHDHTERGDEGFWHNLQIINNAIHAPSCQTSIKPI